jgi:hypothetical protein
MEKKLAGREGRRRRRVPLQDDDLLYLFCTMIMT